MYVDVLIVGAGPAGLAAAIAAREAGIENLLVLEREGEMGGILRQCIHNGFGLHRFGEELTGPEYAQRDIDRVRDLGIEVRCGTTVLSVDEDRGEAAGRRSEANDQGECVAAYPRPDAASDRETHFVVAVSKERGVQLFEAGAVVLAMGCRERPRGALGTPGTRPAGVYSAGTAQKFVNLEGTVPGTRVVVLGSGDIGLIMARRMTLQGAKVLACVEIMPYSSGLNRNIVQCLQDYEIPLLFSHTVVDIEGRERLNAVVIAQVDGDRNPIAGTEQRLECDTLLLSVGLIPENELSQQAGVLLSPVTLGPVVDDSLQTSRPGIFACGNVLHVHDLVDFVSAESLKAGKAAANRARNLAADPLPGPEGRPFMPCDRSDDVPEVGEAEPRVAPILDGAGVRGVVPQKLRIIGCQDAPESVQLMFRPAAVYENAWVRVMDGDREVFKQKKRIFTPGEMADLWLKPEHLQSLSGADITVTIET